MQAYMSDSEKRRDALASKKRAVIGHIQDVFGGTPYPGDPYLQGSYEGCEPYDEVGFFKGKTDWRAIDPAELDMHYMALSFFSEAGFRFFLPAYLIADLRDQLRTAEPLFHLTGGFHTTSIEIPLQGGRFLRKTGGTVLLNPQRYGAITFQDYARFRLSVFCREEAAAIVAYLEYRRGQDEYGIHTAAIDAALDAFWRERATAAATREALQQHLRAEAAFVAQLGGPAESAAKNDDA
jgi:hypothetical protein